MTYIEVIFRGKSGNSYKFTVFPTDTPFKDVGAVYIFGIHKSLPSGHNVSSLYIGQTDKLGQRIPWHEKRPCVNQHGCNCICIHAENTDQARQAIEKDLLDVGKPVCND